MPETVGINLPGIHLQQEDLLLTSHWKLFRSSVSLFLEQRGLKETIPTSFMNNHLRCDRAYSLKRGEECCHAAEFESGGVMKIKSASSSCQTVGGKERFTHHLVMSGTLMPN